MVLLHVLFWEVLGAAAVSAHQLAEHQKQNMQQNSRRLPVRLSGWIAPYFAPVTHKAH